MDSWNHSDHYRDVADEEATGALAALLARHARPGMVIGLSGTLGAGKSVFARAFGHALGISGPMPSPSFPILLEYPGNPGLCHMDWYRLGHADEVHETGAFEYLGRDGWVCLVEWWSRFPEIMPRDSLLVHLEITGPASRRIHLGIPPVPEYASLGDALGPGAGKASDD